MIVAASTECFVDMPLADALERLVDLEFSNVEIDIHEAGSHLRPSDVLSNLDRAVDVCRNTRRLNIVSFSFDSNATGSEYYEQFQACCRLAKAMKVVSITVPSAELGTPFNEEVERLRQLVDIASVDSVIVSIRSQVDRLSQDPDTVVVLCDNVRGLGVTLDPSHYLYGPHGGASFEKLMKYTYHVHLRDTSKEQLQVRIGQGDVDYGKLVNQLSKVKYERALSVHVSEMPDIDQMVELRKLRLLLESLL